MARHIKRRLAGTRRLGRFTFLHRRGRLLIVTVLIFRCIDGQWVMVSVIDLSEFPFSFPLLLLEALRHRGQQLLVWGQTGVRLVHGGEPGRIALRAFDLS
jgi:hypothetical protein